MSKRSKKMYILNIMRDKKHILFGCSEKVNSQLKVDEWKCLTTRAHSRGLIGLQRDWRHLRDVWWQNLKRATMLKIKNSKNNEKMGNDRQLKFNEVDNIVLDIMRKESPILEVISKVSEEDNLKDSNFVSEVNDSLVNIENVPIAIIDSINIPNSNSSSKKRRCQQVSNNENDENEKMIQLKQIRLELEIYNLRLDALKKERDLNLPPSQFTEELNLNDIFLVKSELI